MEIKKMKTREIDFNLINFFVILAVLSVFFVLGLRLVLFDSAPRNITIQGQEIIR